MTNRPAADLAYAVEKINRVPNRHRVYDESPEVARTRYRIDADLLAQVLDLGLPSQGNGVDMRLDALDLRNLAISLRLNVPWFVVMRWWASALKDARAGVSRAYRIGLASRCRHCPHSDTCIVSTSAEVIAAAEEVTPSSVPPVDLYARCRLTGSATTMPAEVAEVLRLADPVEWHQLPVALATDVGFLRDTRLADCRSMTHNIHQEALRRDLRARTAFGLIVTSPFSSEHQWVEFDVDGTWLPADPLLINSMARWGFLDAAEWPSTTSLSGLTWRISQVQVPLVMHDAFIAEATLPTTIESKG